MGSKTETYKNIEKETDRKTTFSPDWSSVHKDRKTLTENKLIVQHLTGRNTPTGVPLSFSEYCSCKSSSASLPALSTNFLFQSDERYLLMKVLDEQVINIINAPA